MENSVLVQVDQRLQNLVEEPLGLFTWKGLVVPLSPHVLLQVVLEVFEHQIELVLRVYHFLKPALNKARYFLTQQYLGA